MEDYVSMEYYFLNKVFESCHFCTSAFIGCQVVHVKNHVVLVNC